MEILEEISAEDLHTLRDLYKVNWPLHVATHSTIQIFIERFKKLPEWKARVKFLSFKDVWKTNGAFIISDENRVFFNTLEEFPFKVLKRMFLHFELPKKVAFVNIRDYLRPIIFETIRLNHYEVVNDIGSKSFLISKEDLKKLTINPPDGYYLKPVRKEHVKKINRLWTGKFENSEKFLEEAIENNPSMGLYSDNGELLAWNMRLDSGSMGVGCVDVDFSGNRFGHLAIIALAVKIAKDFDSDVHFEIVNSNFLAQKSARNSNLPIIDTQSWVTAKRMEKPEAYPMWGHL